MALTMKTFGRLVSLMSSFDNRDLDESEIERIYNCAVDIAHVETMTNNYTNLDPLFKALLNPNDKIEAIKQYRAVTGQGLKESKDAVESIMFKMKY